MSLAWIFLIILLISLALVVWAEIHSHRNPPPLHGGGLFIWAMVFFVPALILGVRTGSSWYSERECARYAERTERAEVRFITTGYFSWDCYVLTSDGWIPRGDIRKVEEN